MILEKHYLQTVHECTKSYIELIALYVHQKNSNHLRSHLRAIVTLDHSIFGTGITVWHEIFSGVYFCGLADFCVLCELIFAIRTDWFSESTQYLELMIFSFLSSTCNRKTYFETILRCAYPM